MSVVDEMTCRAFKVSVADWASGRLSPVQAQRMADHLCRCAGCQREAQAETALRGLWHDAAPAPRDPVLWPQIARRLETAPALGGRPFSVFGPPRWTFVGAVGLAAIAAGGLWLGPKVPPEAPQRVSITSHIAPTPTPEASQIRDTSWAVLPDMSHMDPAVDDPAGPSTEDVLALASVRRTGVR